MVAPLITSQELRIRPEDREKNSGSDFLKKVWQSSQNKGGAKHAAHQKMVGTLQIWQGASMQALRFVSCKGR